MSTARYTSVTSAADVTEEILEAAVSIYDGWHAKESTVDWTDLLDRLDGMELVDGSTLDLGMDLTTPAIVKIKRHVQQYAKAG